MCIRDRPRCTSKLWFHGDAVPELPVCIRTSGVSCWMNRCSPELPSSSLELRCALSDSLGGPPGNSAILSPTPESSGCAQNSGPLRDLWGLAWGSRSPPVALPKPRAVLRGDYRLRELR
eukprot:10767855-Alexandrium_andersonii.AAC.1